jgi:hypothetical protein
MSPARAATALRAVLFLIPLSLINLPDVALHHALRSPPCAPAQSSAAPAPPIAHLTDLSLAPLLWPGVIAGTSSSAHERESDFSAFLYAENRLLFVFDQAGPVCLTRLFYATSGDLVWEGWGFFERAVLHVEVDGVGVLAAPAGSLFNRSLGWPPPPLSTYVPHFFARGGNALLAPVCAERRLRLAWSFPVGDAEWGVDEALVKQALAGEGGVAPSTLALLHAVTTAEDLLLHSDACVHEGKECLLKLYFDAGFVKLPGLALPRGWATFGGVPPPRLAAQGATAGALPSPPPPLAISFSAALAAAEAAAEPSFSRTVCGDAAREWALSARGGAPFFSAAGAGTVVGVRLEADSPGDGGAAARSMLHSFRVSLEGRWDAEAAGGTAGETAGGLFSAPLGALWGPAELGYGKDAVPLRASAQQGLATVDINATARAAYLLLPAPFWAAARLALVADADFEGASEGVRLCATALATRAVVVVAAPPPPNDTAAAPPAASCGAGLDEPLGGGGGGAGYLQARAYDFFVKAGEENALLRVSGVVGKLVGVTSLLQARRGAYPSSVVEGDVRAWVDGARSPSTWDTGYEDFFNGAHTYEFQPHRTGEPFFAHQRRDTERWMAHANAGCINAGGVCPPWLAKLHSDLDAWSSREMRLDALPFLHSLELTLEGFFGQFDMAQLRGAALFYGRPAARAPAVTDALFPGAEFYAAPGAARRHGYAVVLPQGAVGRFDAASAFAGRGEPGGVEDGSCPLRDPGAGGGGVAYINCPAPLLTLPALLLPPGSVASFSLRVDPRAARVALRRTWDARRTGGAAELRVDGALVARLLASDRPFATYNTHWREATVHLPPALTRGRAALALSVHVDGAGVGARAAPLAAEGAEWCEAEWAAVSFYD